MQLEDIFLCDLTHTGAGLASDTFPLGIGFIASYLSQNLPDGVGSINTHLYKFPDKLFSDFEEIKPRIIGFSEFVWNSRISRVYAEKIKEKYPQTIVVFGGANISLDPHEQEQYLRQNRFIDLIVVGEGEAAFKNICDLVVQANGNLGEIKNENIGNARYLDRQGKFCIGRSLPRIKLFDVYSPYLGGFLDKFFDTDLMPLIQTTRGCPFTCTFCVEGHEYFNQITHRKREEIDTEIEYIGNRTVRNKQLFIANSNFGMFKEDLETSEMLGRQASITGFPSFVQVATGKNKKERVLQCVDALGGRMRVTGSVQSTDLEVLRNTKRENISKESLMSFSVEATKYGGNTYSEIILGLPGDSKATHLVSIQEMVDADFNVVLPWTLMALNGTEIGARKTREQYGFLSKYRVLPRCFGKYDIGGAVQNIAETEEVIVGSNTLSFEDYVYCRLIALTTALFFNDNINYPIVVDLKNRGISRFDWIQRILTKRPDFPLKLSDLFDRFETHTRTELWDSRIDLEKHSSTEEAISSYLNGQEGFNVINFIKAEAIVEAMDEVVEVSILTYEETLRSNAVEITKQIKEYSDAIKKVSTARQAHLFESRDQIVELNNMELREKGDVVEIFPRKDTSVRYKFFHSTEQSESVEKMLDIYGRDLTGITKIISRISLKNYLRKFELMI